MIFLKFNSKSSQHTLISNSGDCHLKKQLSSIGRILNKYLPSISPSGGGAATAKGNSVVSGILTESKIKYLD